MGNNNYVIFVLFVLFDLFSLCLSDGDVHQFDYDRGVLNSYIGNYIITREAIFVISLIALILSWRALVHVVFHRHRVISDLLKLREDFGGRPPFSFVVEGVGAVFDEAMKLYGSEDHGDDDHDFNYYYDEDMRDDE